MCLAAHFVVSYYFPSLAPEKFKKTPYQLKPHLYLTTVTVFALKAVRSRESSHLSGWRYTAIKIIEISLSIFARFALVFTLLADILFYPLEMILGNGYTYYRNLCLKRAFKKFEIEKNRFIKNIKIFSIPIYIGSAILTHPLSIPSIFIASIYIFSHYV